MPIVSVCVCLSLSLSLSTLLLCNLFGPLLLGPFTPTKDMEEETTVYADEQFKKKKKKKGGSWVRKDIIKAWAEQGNPLKKEKMNGNKGLCL